MRGSSPNSGVVLGIVATERWCCNTEQIKAQTDWLLEPGGTSHAAYDDAIRRVPPPLT